MRSTALQQNLRDKLKLRSLSAASEFAKKHPHAKEFFEEAGLNLGKIREHSAKLLTAGTLSGALLLSPGIPDTQTSLPQPIVEAVLPTTIISEDPESWLAQKLNILLPLINNPFKPPFLIRSEEKIIGKLIEQTTGVPAVATLEGEHLNTTYGYIGAEQHLRRYPGDTLAKHDQFQSAGIAPSLGGFGYFTEGGKLTDQAVLREKYYVVAQLMYLPDWDKRVRYLADWYKWRKIVVVNADSGKAAVGVMGDAGPAAWTGKHFGGSPEIMNILGGPKYKKGRVLFFFVDDPENKIALGEVKSNKIELPAIEALNESLKRNREEAKVNYEQSLLR